MAGKPPIDLKIAHHYFAAECFNMTWELLEKKVNRTPEDDLQMELRAMASLWHWTQRPDCEPVNLSIGYWQIARVHAMLRRPAAARQWAERCLDVTQKHKLEPFYLGYAYEALARAEAAAANQMAMEAHLAKAQEAAAQVKDDGDKKQLLADLDTVGVNPSQAETKAR